MHSLYYYVDVCDSFKVIWAIVDRKISHAQISLVK